MSSRFAPWLRGFLVPAFSLLAMLPPIAAAQTFSNAAAISVPDGPAFPYPSTINVSGFTGAIGNITVRLHDVRHTYVGDITAVLTAPDGRPFVLVRRCGGATSVTGVTVGFSPLAPNFFGGWISGGIFRPRTCLEQGLPPPGPPEPFSEDLSDLFGINPNGTWSLFVHDGASGDFGSIAGGWSIEFEPVTPTPISTNAFTYQGRLTQDGEPFNGPVTARFRIYAQATGGTPLAAAQLATPIAQDGHLTSLVNLPADLIDPSNPPFLEVAINGQTLSPRTRLTPTPVASRATRAEHATVASSADFAMTAQSASVAQSVNWSNIQGRPAIANWVPGLAPNSASIDGPVAIGQTSSPANAKLAISAATLAPIEWHVNLKNDTAPTWLGGLRLSDNGFVEMTNNAFATVPNVARLNSSGAWTTVSDARLKGDVHAASGLLEQALRIRPVYFRWLSDTTDANDLGVIAQELRDVAPQLVTGDEAKESLTVSYSQLSVVAIGAIQELKAQHDAELAAMRQHIETLAQQNAELLRRLELLEGKR